MHLTPARHRPEESALQRGGAGGRRLLAKIRYEAAHNVSQGEAFLAVYHSLVS